MEHMEHVETKTKTLGRGIDGSGKPVFIVFVDWIDKSGRKRTKLHRFTSEAEARCWMQHA